MSRPPRIVGLTGGIAAGKSSVARELADAGLAVLDADQLARDVLAPGQPLLDQVVAEFGEGVRAADGSLDRKALGAIVFGDEAARKRLEALTHPAIARASMERFIALGQQGHALVVYEAALLVETGRHAGMDRLVVVTADDDERVRRIVARDGLSEAEARQRIDAQMPQAQKAALADHVIDNSGDVEAMQHAARALADELARWAAAGQGEGAASP